MSNLLHNAQRVGIEDTYIDVWGKRQTVAEDTIAHILSRLGSVEESSSILPPVQVIPAESLTSLPIAANGCWQVISEDGSTQGGDISRHKISLPALAMGYYDLIVEAEQTEQCRLIVAPPKCWMQPDMDKGKRVWGIAAQLYGIRSDNNWGMGDFGDLRAMVDAAARIGADVIGLNPLHALFPSNPQHFSPYSPSNRLFLNTLFIDIASVANFERCQAAQALWNDPEFQKKLSMARQAELVDYPLVAELKTAMLLKLYDDFITQPPEQAYTNFLQTSGTFIFKQATFEVLCAHFHREQGRFIPWWEWPEPYRSPHSAEVKEFARERSAEVDFYCWLQWLADSQLQAAQQAAMSQGMRLGLYRDLAVGCDRAGSEMWEAPENFIPGVTIGAPPDEYNRKGQNWGLPPLNPLVLKKRGYAPFIQLLRANMRHCRALRIDHAFGLARLFLIPEGGDAAHGAYLRYPFDDLLAVIRLESHRQQCIVIGEDLGTFPPGYKEKAAESGILSYRVLYFEREQDRFIPPDRYPAQALVTLSTHDLPTLKGWLAQKDIDEREKLGLYPDPDLIGHDRADRSRSAEGLKVAFRLEGLYDSQDDPISLEKVQRYLSRTPSAIVMTQLEDVLGVIPQVNLPATTTERPNWQQRLPQKLDEIFRKKGALAKLGASMSAEREKSLVEVPRATYRLQFHKGFTFYDAAAILPYLTALGVSHVYASPYLKARPDSQHGYDITDHQSLNPELGGEEGYAAFLSALQEHGLKQILDFVPNHMGVGGSDNAWWLSVLEWGQDSPCVTYFDIDWTPRYPGATPKLVLPFLGDHYGDALDKGDMALSFDATEGSFSVWYAEHRFPICPREYAFIHKDIAAVQTYQEGEECKAALKTDLMFHAALVERAQALTADRDALHQLLERQHYMLAYWRSAATDINYRRFFDISDLAGVRPEVPELFERMHKRVLSLIHDKQLHGLRIDHIDGLADPEGYVNKLREKCGVNTYIIVEKILAEQEILPEGWEIQGTSGYDALNTVGDLFCEPKAAKAFDRIYQRFTGRQLSLEEETYSAKLLILDTTLASELEALSLKLHRMTSQDRYTRDYTLDRLRAVLREIIGWFSVYRSYNTPTHVATVDAKLIDRAIARARTRSRMPDPSVYDVIASKLLMEEKPPREDTVDFVRKFQQLTGPVMAKGVEDTAFYRYNRLVSLNEVGGNPGHFGISAKAFHQNVRSRAAKWPHSMISTATHDTKRGEDMRMRLHALSEMPMEWSRCLRRWSTFNRSRVTEVENSRVPSPNDEYFIYQTLLGSWPHELMHPPLSQQNLSAYISRLCAYMIKALREAKLHTGWSSPDEAYENAVLSFIHGILDVSGPNVFVEDMLPVARRLAAAGAVNSLCQVLLKLTLPGVPDIYQGTEYWDLSLVDPDNRRAVDYEKRLKAVNEDTSLISLLSTWHDGRVKQKLLALLLAHRSQHEDLYRSGDYQPLTVKGANAKHVLAFARKAGNKSLVAVIPLQISKWLEEGKLLPVSDLWKDTHIILPSAGPYTHILTGENVPSRSVYMADCLKAFPCALIAPA